MKTILVLLLVPFCICAKYPPFLKKCNKQQPDFKKCLTTLIEDTFKHGTKAYPEISLPVLDPLSLPKLDIGAGSGPVGFAQHYTDCKILGISSIIAQEDNVMDFDKNEFILKGTIPLLSKLCRYKIDGKIMVMPIKGEGPSNITMVDLQVTLKVKLSKFEKNGENFYKIENCQVDLDPKLIKFQIENLFDGNKQLSDNINKVMNENWAEVFRDVKHGYEMAFVEIFTQIVNALFSKIPISAIIE